MTRDGTGDEGDRAAAMAQDLAQRGWPVALVRQAAEGAELAGHPEDRAFWERVADELDAIKTRSGFRVIGSLARRLGTPEAILGEPEQGKPAGHRVGDQFHARFLAPPQRQAPLSVPRIAEGLDPPMVVLWVLVPREPRSVSRFGRGVVAALARGRR